MPARKIATCCYCGTRAALVLDRARHELVCSSCGAPLHELKMLPKAPDRATAPAATPARPEPRRRALPASALRGKKVKKSRKKKSFGRWAMDELWDVVEDIFD